MPTTALQPEATYKSLYTLTGVVLDINTLLVPRLHVRTALFQQEEDSKNLTTAYMAGYASGKDAALAKQQELVARLDLMTSERDKLARQVEELELQRTRIPQASHPDTRTVLQ